MPPFFISIKDLQGYIVGMLIAAYDKKLGVK